MMAQLSVAFARRNFASMQLRLDLSDFSQSVATSPWLFQLFKTVFPVSLECNTTEGECSTLMAKTVACANLAHVGRAELSERCCVQKELIKPRSNSSIKLSQKGQVEVKLGESSSPGLQMHHGTEAYVGGRDLAAEVWPWPASMSQLVPQIMASRALVVGDGTPNTLTEGFERTNIITSSVQSDGVGRAARFGVTYRPDPAW